MNVSLWLLCCNLMLDFFIHVFWKLFHVNCSFILIVNSEEYMLETQFAMGKLTDLTSLLLIHRHPSRVFFLCREQL